MFTAGAVDLVWMAPLALVMYVEKTNPNRRAAGGSGQRLADRPRRACPGPSRLAPGGNPV